MLNTADTTKRETVASLPEKLGDIERISAIELAKEIETLFHLDLPALYTLPLATQLAIIAKAGKRDLPAISAKLEGSVS
jgi:hypothetical protein